MKEHKKDIFTVLVVDDDRSTRDGLALALRGKYDVRLAANAEAALVMLENDDVDVLLTDMRMPGMDGLTLIQRALARTPDLICFLLTAYGSIETAVQAIRNGARDFLTKPVNLDHLDIQLERALRARDIEAENMELRRQLDSKFGLENIIGSAAAMQPVFDIIRQAAPSQATVLIQGESGTGKELVAQAFHRLSPRRKGPFVAIHCAALTPSLLESELFGHEKGAFTGAVARRRGRFERADGGSLFLDEISEIDATVQVKLLRVLEERTFERVGGTETVETDIRLISATNKDLRQLAEEGKFREDLFFRLDVVNVTLPPLRDRADDIPLLCNHFIREFCERNHKEIGGMTADALNILADYRWPGNVRELRNVVEKMVVLARGDRLTARDVPARIREEAGGCARARIGTGADAEIARGSLPTGTLEEAERAMIMAALRRHGDNRTLAAEELGISRRTLHRKLNAYRLQS